MRIISGGICETGDRRENNQDHILYVNRKEAGHETGLFLVADGMGGLACGMETSGYIVQEFLRWWEQDVSWMFAYGKTSDEDILELLDNILTCTQCPILLAISSAYLLQCIQHLFLFICKPFLSFRYYLSIRYNNNSNFLHNRVILACIVESLS